MEIFVGVASLEAPALPAASLRWEVAIVVAAWLACGASWIIYVCASVGWRRKQISMANSGVALE